MLFWGDANQTLPTCFMTGLPPHEAIRAATGQERVALLGHSFGGLLALHYALKYPDRVAAMVLLDPDPASRELWAQHEQIVESRLTDEDRMLMQTFSSSENWELDPVQVENYHLARFQAYFGKREASVRLQLGLSQSVYGNFPKTALAMRESLGDWDLFEELRELEKNLKQAAKGGGASRGKGAEALGRRLRTLYKSLEIDDRAVDTLFALRDESMKLKAEEAIKRLTEEADNVAVRRKVGGLPNHLHVFELGFAGKGRIYYTRGKQQRFRILTVGAKNSQDSDMDYMRRLSRDEMA